MKYVQDGQNNNIFHNNKIRICENNKITKTHTHVSVEKGNQLNH